MVATKSLSTSPVGFTAMAAIILDMAASFSFRNGASASSAPRTHVPPRSAATARMTFRWRCLLHSGAADCINVSTLQDGALGAMAGNSQHGTPDRLCCEYLSGKKCPQDRKQRSGQRVEPAVRTCLRLDTVQGLYDTGPEQVNTFEGQAHQSVFGFPLYAGPHAAPALSTVGSGSRDIHESHLRIEARKNIRHRQRPIVGHFGVAGLSEPGRGDPQAEETGVEIAEFRLNFTHIHEGRADHLAQLRVLLQSGGPPDRQHLFDVRSLQTLAQNAATHHSCGAEQQHSHDGNSGNSEGAE